MNFAYWNFYVFAQTHKMRLKTILGTTLLATTTLPWPCQGYLPKNQISGVKSELCTYIYNGHHQMITLSPVFCWTTKYKLSNKPNMLIKTKPRNWRRPWPSVPLQYLLSSHPKMAIVPVLIGCGGLNVSVYDWQMICIHNIIGLFSQFILLGGAKT